MASSGTTQAVQKTVVEFFAEHTFGWGKTSADRDRVVNRLFGEVILPVLRQEPSSANLLIAVGRVAQAMSVHVMPKGAHWLEGRAKTLLGR